MTKAYRLSPAFKDVIWGGTAFSDIYKMDIPTSSTGEAFVASVVPGFISSHNGESFEKIACDKALTGEGGFNLLFKLIDARDKLSVQVHPDDELALKLENGRGKTECWYVLSAEKDAFLYLGFKEGVTKADFERTAREGGMEEILNKVPVAPGDFFFVPSGTVHAIGAGLLIAELQQSCDITYRVYDYERRDKNGSTRPLHTEKALLCAKVAPYENAPSRMLSSECERLCSCPYFTFDRVKSSLSTEKTEDKYMLLFFEKGNAVITLDGEKYTASPGDTFFIPAHSGPFTVEGEATYLRMAE